ncbi:GNAT family N-acetyltransferase [Sphingobacterium sp. KU25419]|nr:GNAT family N-acetyltransferase [Sphingobacterium sp. KU25419]
MVEISTEKAKLDLNLIHGFIGSTYWAKGRTMEEMKTCMDNSLNFGVYLDGHQIGYARVLTDYFQFAYLMDVFILEQHRGHGYARELMEHIFSHELLKEIRVWRLATNDAHGLYEKFGFAQLAKPEKLMERLIQ